MQTRGVRAEAYCVSKDGLGCCRTNSVNVLQRVLNPLLIWDFYPSNTSRLNMEGDASLCNLRTDPSSFVTSDAMEGWSHPSDPKSSLYSPTSLAVPPPVTQGETISMKTWRLAVFDHADDTTW